MSKLDDDLAVYLAATTAAERQAALQQWLTDATAAFGIIADRLQQLADADDDAGRALWRRLKMIELRALRRGLLWNPERLQELTNDPDVPAD